MSNRYWSTSVRVLAAIAAIAAVTGIGFPGRAGSTAIDLADLDRGCSACRDFYQFATGGWRARHPIPPAFGMWGRDLQLAEQTRDKLHGILDAAAANPESGDADWRRIGLFYRSCMDTSAIEASGTAPIDDDLAAIGAVADSSDLADVAARINLQGAGALFTLSGQPDLTRSDRITAEIDQAGLGLPERDYYLRSDDGSRRIRAAYEAHIATQFRNLGEDAASAAHQAAAVVAIESRLARSSVALADLRDPKTLHHPMTPGDLQKLAPGIDWPRYFRASGAPAVARLNVSEPQFFSELSRTLGAVPLADWKAYLRWHVVLGSSSSLPARFEAAAFSFYGTTLRGRKEQAPRWKRCAGATNRLLGNALGKEYVKRFFSPAARAQAQTLIDGLTAVLREDLANLAWMSPQTRARALRKLAAVHRKIGFPAVWRDDRDLVISARPYGFNARAARSFENRRNLDKIGGAVDRDEWFVSAATVNAYYDAQNNDIIFPAGFLQPPFFDPAGDPAANYGLAGATIGHELIHAFDDQGRHFDGAGNLVDWWSGRDAAEFDRRTQCLVDQADAYVAIDGLHLHGRLVVGEAAADLGGLRLAYRAFERTLAGKRRVRVDGFTPEQRFFLAFAGGWATSATPETTRLMVQSNPHPPAAFRVDATLANMPEFSAAFACSARDQMVAAKRCRVW